MKRKLVLQNGETFIGESFGSQQEVISEVVFNTAVVGYQEILSDPTNNENIVCMTYPIIGSYGMTDEDYESKNNYAKALVVKEYNDSPSNFRYTRTLSEVMEENHVVGLCGIDTRKLTRIIQQQGTMKGIICDEDKSLEECLKLIEEYSTNEKAYQNVSSKKVWYSRTANYKYTVVTLDLGVRLNLIKKLNQQGCNVVVVPYNTSLADIMKYKPDGLFISNGPGNPNQASEVIELIKEAKGKLPILGVGMGMNIISLAYGATVNKMKFGHHGVNHPVKCLETGKIEITTQNTNYSVCEESLKNTELTITHKNVLDNEVEGIVNKKDNVIAVSYNPETGAGLQKEAYIIYQFTKLMQGGKR